MSNRPVSALPRIVKLLAINAAAGAAAGCVFAGGLCLSDAGGIATLIGQSSAATQITAAAMLFGGFALTFASLTMASAVMLLGK